MKSVETMRTPHEVAEFHEKRSDIAGTALLLSAAGAIIYPLIWGVVGVMAIETVHQVWRGAKAHLEATKKSTPHS